MRNSARVLVSSALLVGFLGQSSFAQEDTWADLRPLVGTWKGVGSGLEGKSEVTHEWNFVMQGKFLKLSTRSVSQKQDGTEEVHEDAGFLSRDTDRGAFVFRHFLSEGVVNTYAVNTAPENARRIVFEHREAESAGGMGARMELAFATDDEYELVLELATPGKDFAPCQQMTMKRLPSGTGGTTVSDLAWLAGCWASIGRDPGSGEQWTAPAGKTMFGVSRVVEGTDTVAHEFMQIRATDTGDIEFVAQPSGQTGATFVMVRASEGEVVFQNLEHDFPQRVIYRLESHEKLIGRIEGEIEGKHETVDFPLKRIDCGS